MDRRNFIKTANKVAIATIGLASISKLANAQDNDKITTYHRKSGGTGDAKIGTIDLEIGIKHSVTRGLDKATEKQRSMYLNVDKYLSYENDTYTKQVGRPKGTRFDRRLDVRFPAEMLRCLKKRAREAGVSNGELVRMCVESYFCAEAKKLIAVIKDDNSPGRLKVRAIGRLRELRKAALACSDWGLQIARGKAIQKDRKQKRW